MSNSITAWSYSRWKLYEQCPLKFKLKNIDKLPEPKSPHAQRGIDIHKKGEDFLTGKLRFVPDEYKCFSTEMKQLRKDEARAEEKWAFDSNWNPLNNYFDKEVWVRQITDANVDVDHDIVRVIDFKTGRIYDDYDDQMMMFATGAFHEFENLKEVQTELLFVDQGKIIKNKFKVSELPFLVKHWEDKTRPMFSDTEFCPKKNQYCKWCHYRKDNGGPCPY